MDYAVIQDDILEALAPLKISHKIRTLELYSGQLDVEDKDIPKLTRLFPAVYIICPDAEWSTGNRTDIIDIRLEVFCADKSFAPNASDPVSGVQALLLGVRGVLHKKRISAAAPVVAVIRERIAAYYPKIGLSVSVAEYNIKLRE